MTPQPYTDLLAEVSVLGACLLDNARIDDLAAHVSESHFDDPLHAAVWKAVLAVHGRGQAVDLVTLQAELAAKNQLGRIGVDGLIALVDAVPAAANAVHYARLVRANAEGRALHVACQNIRASIEAGRMTPKEAALAMAEAAAFAGSDSMRKVVTAAEAVEQVRAEAESVRDGKARPMLKTGFREWDWLTGGLLRGEQTLIQAYTSHGKSALGLALAHNAAAAGEGVAIVSSEMGAKALAYRQIAMLGGPGRSAIYNPRGMAPDDYAAYDAACQRVEALPIVYVTDLEGGPREWAALAAQRLGNTPLTVMLVDYIQCLPVTRRENRNQELGEVCRQINDLARQRDLACITLSQMIAERGGRELPPRLNKARDCGELDNHPGMVAELTRPHKDGRDGHDDHATVTVLKNRNGPLGDFVVSWNPARTLFGDWSGPRPEGRPDHYSQAY